MDEDHAFSPEADTKQILDRTERQAAWFPVVAIAFLALLYAGAKWRAEDPLVYLVLGCGLILALLGAELLRTKALILRIEYMRLRSLRIEQERQLQMRRLEQEMLGANATEKPEDSAPV